MVCRIFGRWCVTTRFYDGGFSHIWKAFHSHGGRFFIAVKDGLLLSTDKAVVFSLLGSITPETLLASKTPVFSRKNPT